MKFFTSSAPMSQGVKDGLAAKGGRDSFIEFLNGRAAGEHNRLHLHIANGEEVELTAEPVKIDDDAAAA